MLVTQKEQLEAESARRVAAAVSAERDEFYAMMQSSIERMSTVEAALDGRKQQVNV